MHTLEEKLLPDSSGSTGGEQRHSVYDNGGGQLTAADRDMDHVCGWMAANTAALFTAMRPFGWGRRGPQSSQHNPMYVIRTVSGGDKGQLQMGVSQTTELAA